MTQNNQLLPSSSRSYSQPYDNSGSPDRCAVEAYLPAVIGGPHWHGRESFENIVVIGDSYSNFYQQKTWINCLETRLQDHPSKIHNFAFPGATAQDDLSSQLFHFYANFPKGDSTDKAPALDPDRTTYFFFLGINDCGRSDLCELEPIVEALFDAVHNLYIEAGARNFVFVDIPPMNRSPRAAIFGVGGEIEERIKTWNSLLRTNLAAFGTSSTLFLFSSHQVLTEVLDDPLEFDFNEDDPMTESGGIWEDDLHLTTGVHDVLADRLFASFFAVL